MKVLLFIAPILLIWGLHLPAGPVIFLICAGEIFYGFKCALNTPSPDEIRANLDPHSPEYLARYQPKA